ncbi:helix-turn-helix transcriptional regulator [Agarivorans sp. DSG3-1]|uniref:helix-turn-helix transcriptional regulator n=1 Tax=Agarivorans sp. DSG3-1 TaxID=3342249 RepID=UPI00398F01B5
MEKLLVSIQKAVSQLDVKELPFSVYSSVHEQMLLNVPISKPLLIVVINGNKQLGENASIACPSDHFIFLSDSPAINMRNIPKGNSYFALLIEFDYQDFSDLHSNVAAASKVKPDYFVAKTNAVLKQCLQQFVECSLWAPKELQTSRKREILRLLYSLGHRQITMMMGKPKVSHRLHELFRDKHFNDLSIATICEHLAMSESTLRRKLNAEGTSVQEVKDRARLGLGLHLLQTSDEPIGLIAEKCGYHSPSRFTDRFKSHFGLTSSELRKTRMTE